MTPYGCHNRQPFRPTYRVEDRDSHGYRVLRELPHFGRPDCAYTHTALGQADARCLGCNWRVSAANEGE